MTKFLRIFVNNFSYLEWSSTFSFRVGKKHPSTNKQNKESCDFDLSTEKTQKISDWHQSILSCHNGLKLFPNEHSYFLLIQQNQNKVLSWIFFSHLQYKGSLPNATFGPGEKSHQPNFASAKHLEIRIRQEPSVPCFESTENRAQHCFKIEQTSCTVKVTRSKKHLAKTQAQEVCNKNDTPERIPPHCACLVFFAKSESLTDLLCHFANRFNSKQNTTKVFVIFFMESNFHSSKQLLKNI